MPKEKRLDFNHLLTKEVHSLVSTNAWQVPRVIRFIDQGLSARGDRCLVLEYALALVLTIHNCCQVLDAHTFQDCLRLLDVCCLDHNHYASLYLCRLVEGGSLKTWLQGRSSSTKADNEEQMLAVASQMFNVRHVESTEMLSATMPCNPYISCSSVDCMKS